MTVEDAFREKAERCRVMAEASTTNADQAFWLLLAENWQRLAQDREAEPPDEREQMEIQRPGPIDQSPAIQMRSISGLLTSINYSESSSSDASRETVSAPSASTLA